MQIPHPVLITLLGGGVAVAPIASAASPDAPSEVASSGAIQIPAKVMATMAADLGSPDIHWDYDFNPYPPCSFG